MEQFDGTRNIEDQQDDQPALVGQPAEKSEHDRATTAGVERSLGAVAVGSEAAGTPEADAWRPPIEIWVASLTDYANGRLHGVWIDATQEPEELHETVSYMLSRSNYPDAEEWAIFDYEGFGTVRLGEHASLDTVSRIAKGIEEHGLAYAAWADYVGVENEHELERFEDHYRGEYYSVQAYVEDVLDNIGFNHDLDLALRVIPEDLRRYVAVDVDGLARGWEVELHVVARNDGKVWIFDC